jgi:hypothetical protein
MRPERDVDVLEDQVSGIPGTKENRAIYASLSSTQPEIATENIS